LKVRRKWKGMSMLLKSMHKKGKLHDPLVRHSLEYFYSNVHLKSTVRLSICEWQFIKKIIYHHLSAAAMLTAT